MVPVFKYKHTVVEEEIDELRHVYNVRYLDWLIKAAKGHCVALGWPDERFFELGAAWVVRTHTLRYRQPAYMGDKLTVRTWVVSMRNASSKRRYEIIRDSDGVTVLTGQTDWAFIDLASGKPRRIPDEIAESFPLVDDEK